MNLTKSILGLVWFAIKVAACLVSAHQAITSNEALIRVLSVTTLLTMILALWIEKASQNLKEALLDPEVQKAVRQVRASWENLKTSL